MPGLPGKRTAPEKTPTAEGGCRKSLQDLWRLRVCAEIVVLRLNIMEADGMEQIRQLLERGFWGGIVFAAALAGFTVFLYLVYRLIKVFQSSKIRQEEQRIRSHRFYKVSGRGRVAYLILCLEETLRFYGQDISAWECVLRKLWSITDSTEGDWIGNWLDTVGELLPSTVLTGKTGKIQNLYTRSGTIMILVNALMENAYAIVCEWSPEKVVYDPDALHYIDSAEEIMEKFGVPLPAKEAIQFLVSQRDSSVGKPFDGLCLSYLSKEI